MRVHLQVDLQQRERRRTGSSFLRAGSVMVMAWDVKVSFSRPGLGSTGYVKADWP